MSFNLIVPEVGAKGTTKDFVITILTERWPLTAKKIYNLIRKQYAYSITYQSVFKAVGELTEKKVLVRGKDGYEINISWIKKLQSFTDIIETNYYSKERIENASGLVDSNSGKEYSMLVFETMFDAEKYLYYLVKDKLTKKKGTKVLHSVFHEWRSLFYFRSEFNFYRKMHKLGHKFQIVCSGNTDVDKESAKFYKSIGVSFKIKNLRMINETIAFDDTVIQIYIPEDVRTALKKYLENEDKFKLIEEGFEKKSNIRVVVTKDKRMASDIISQLS